MGLDEVLRCLAEADADRRRLELCDGRYMLVGYRDELRIDLEGDEAIGEVLGEVSSVYGAFDLLASALAELCGDDPEAATADYRAHDVAERDYEEWLDERPPPPRRRVPTAGGRGGATRRGSRSQSPGGVRQRPAFRGS